MAVRPGDSRAAGHVHEPASRPLPASAVAPTGFEPALPAVRSPTGSPSASMGIPLSVASQAIGYAALGPNAHSRGTKRPPLFQLNAAQVSTTTWPWSENDVTFPSASNDSVCKPAVAPTVGIPNRCASAGEKIKPCSPVPSKVPEPSGNVVTFPGPETFEVMFFPVVRFVAVTLSTPVMRVIMD